MKGDEERIREGGCEAICRSRSQCQYRYAEELRHSNEFCLRFKRSPNGVTNSLLSGVVGLV
jgi:hypothetical protein